MPANTATYRVYTCIVDCLLIANHIQKLIHGKGKRVFKYPIFPFFVDLHITIPPREIFLQFFPMSNNFKLHDFQRKSCSTYLWKSYQNFSYWHQSTHFSREGRATLKATSIHDRIFGTSNEASESSHLSVDPELVERVKGFVNHKMAGWYHRSQQQIHRLHMRQERKRGRGKGSDYRQCQRKQIFSLITFYRKGVKNWKK